MYEDNKARAQRLQTRLGIGVSGQRKSRKDKGRADCGGWRAGDEPNQ